MIEAWLPGQLTQPGSDFKNLQKEVEDFNSDFTGVINTIRKQDQDRNLGYLEKAPTSLMDYPRFWGLESECYFQWQEKMIWALRINKVPTLDKVAKIRGVLSGHPLHLVPESVKLTRSAFDTLNTRYGDEDRVIALRVKDLQNTGKKPEK